MTFADITALLQSRFDLRINIINPQPYLIVEADKLPDVCRFLRDDERLYFDLLACVTAIDNGSATGTLDVFYNFTSIPYAHDLMLRLTMPRDQPNVPTLSHLWQTANWHEREAFDLVGVRFLDHPDLRRILLPTDWAGHPLQTDYQEVERYHGIVNK